MKKTSVLILAVLFSVISLGQEEAVVSKKTQIDVYYFHRTERCKTCLSIEANVQKALDLYFAEEIKDGTIRFISINFEGEDQKKAIEKYEADGPALYLTKVKKGKETTKDLTDFAFNNSLYNGEKFKTGFRDRVNQLLR